MQTFAIVPRAAMVFHERIITKRQSHKAKEPKLDSLSIRTLVEHMGRSLHLILDEVISWRYALHKLN
jgi:hypothetical protein